MRLLFAVLTWVTLFQASGSAEPEAPPSDEPVLSQKGKSRIQSNIRVLATNLKDLEKNLVSAEKNAKTIAAELKDLANLEREHLDLRKKYNAYLHSAKEEAGKNQKAMRDLAAWENQLDPTQAENNSALKEKIASAQAEKADRERWRADAEAKMARVRELLVGVDRNLNDILSRKKPLEQQLETWNQRKTEYEKLVAETKEKIAQFQRILAR